MPKRKTRIKSVSMTLRVSHHVKAAAKFAAENDNRSVGSLIEGLIQKHCKSLGIYRKSIQTRDIQNNVSRSESVRNNDAYRGHDAKKEIRFYRANEKPHGALSNLFPRPIMFEGCKFPTAEHAYQAGKARKEEVREWILSAPTPSLVAMASHGLYTWDIVPNWSRIKLDRMRRVLRAKFTQHEDLKQLLLSTGEARIVETARVANAVNRAWGEVNGKGQNMLGVLLMELRNELRKNETSHQIESGSPHQRRHKLVSGEKIAGSTHYDQDEI